MPAMLPCPLHDRPGVVPISLVEEAILNPSLLGGALMGFRRYRIEYGFECSCPEGLIYLPGWVDPEVVETILNAKVPVFITRNDADGEC